VLGLITRLAARQPLLLVIEDLHWADRSTRDLVVFLVQTLRELGVLLVLTYRSDELHRRHPLRPVVTAWERVRTVERLELGRFTRDEVVAQLRAIRDARPSAAFATVVFERSQGNAFLVEEIVAAVDGGADPGGRPPSLRDVCSCGRRRCRRRRNGCCRPPPRPGRTSTTGCSRRWRPRQSRDGVRLGRIKVEAPRLAAARRA
jgi:hypothetical protein